VAQIFKQSKQDYRDEPKGMLFGLWFSSCTDNIVAKFNFFQCVFILVEFLDVRFFLLEFPQFTFKLGVLMTIGRF
jgi:hypothetical protein